MICTYCNQRPIEWCDLYCQECWEAYCDKEWWAMVGAINTYHEAVWGEFFRRYHFLLDHETIKCYVLDMQDGLLPPLLENKSSLEDYQTQERARALGIHHPRDYTHS